jgi:hypothetical protein
MKYYADVNAVLPIEKEDYFVNVTTINFFLFFYFFNLLNYLLKYLFKIFSWWLTLGA